MSWYRKIKSLYSISLVTISFIIWSTLSKWLFKSGVNYKLFLITLCIVFFTQYLNNLKLKKSLFILALLGVNILACFIFFKGQTIFINIIFLLFMSLITYTLDDAPIDNSQYKEDITKSMIALIIIWAISFTLGADFVNAMYRFHILYIIMIIVLMRETRRYIYAVKSNTSSVTNVIIGISVIALSLDYANKIIAFLFDMLIKLSSFILVLIVDFLIMIFGRPISFIIQKIKEIIIKSENQMIKIDPVEKSLNNQPNIIKYKVHNLSPELLIFLKILIIFIILYLIYKFLSRITKNTKVYNGFVEEKERMINKKNKRHWVKNLFGNMFKGGGSNRDKILYMYSAFEKITEKANIYKTYMTATQLKNVTKINVDNAYNLDEMTELYNEAKFSLHPMTQENVDSVKRGHSNIKKQF
ncbi:hypothetical protein K9O30_09840 [Clostridium bowmanii]|uniref:hypothetical protein n=1 Tax=Clostridium bowmanii TaxID=132925 RepID=UPI001C0D4ED0|nr:hypothetical protein [Clostridium bowmanii]MBU3189400.1 hypothetical protein [Clostridium bowmanii]MCA1074014.1 hypothetical protein [Clostridium bowmanii]